MPLRTPDFSLFPSVLLGHVVDTFYFQKWHHYNTIKEEYLEPNLGRCARTTGRLQFVYLSNHRERYCRIIMLKTRILICNM